VPGATGGERSDAPRTGGPTPASSVYVHAPFCVRRCLYCDFAVQVRRVGDAAEWLEALAGELRVVEREGLLSPAERLDTLYVGGGTPSLLGPEAMAGLRDVLGAARVGDATLEWTAEANPESLTPEVARRWRETGVNRLSLGVQTFHAGALRWMGRMHGPDGAARAVDTGRAAGYENLSVDLIFGLPTHLGRSWRADLERTLELDVPHVSLYGLSVEPATPLGRAVREGRETPVDEDAYRDEFLMAAELLTGAGYRHYEVSNFARPGAESRHNAIYWDGAPYLGLGNGAHSYAHPVRRWNVRDWGAYRDAARAGISPEEGRETLGDDAVRLERIWLGLRTSRGLESAGWGPEALALVEGWRKGGLASLDRGTLRLTPPGWLVLDRLAVDLDHALPA
jgi:putative oxygen-independent coproporphyrinogen III oxidase